MNLYFFLSIAFLGGCETQIQKETTFNMPEEEKMQIKFVEEKKILNNAWYKKISLSLNKEVPIIDVIKNTAKDLNIKLMFNIEEAKGITYAAKNKPFIEILSDICDILDWKLQIKELNGKISKDEPYMQTYLIPYLTGERKGISDSSYSGKPGQLDSKNSGDINIGSSGSLSSSMSLNPFEELRKNLEMLSMGKDGEKTLSFSMHKQAGLLTVIGTQKQHKMIAKYINKLSDQIRTQILIEAKIYEIELYENFVTGINWGNFLNTVANKTGIPINSEFKDDTLNIGILNSGQIPNLQGNIFSFLRTFGKVHSMSNPRVMIANNNVAIFKVVDHKVFFKLTQNEVFDTGKNNNSNPNSLLASKVSSELHTIPVGVILLVQPSIDASGKITIALHPTISEVHEEIDDPAYEIMAAKSGVSPDKRAKIPVVKTRELDTVFTTQEDQIALIGGLLYTSNKNKESGLPLSWLSNKKEKISNKKEIVIAIKAKIVKSNSSYDEIIFLE